MNTTQSKEVKGEENEEAGPLYDGRQVNMNRNYKKHSFLNLLLRFLLHHLVLSFNTSVA